MNNNEHFINLVRIRKHYNILSKSKRKIADYIFDNYQKVINHTAVQLAEETGTSPSTIVWFCRSLGFKGFTDFKMHLEKELLSPITNLISVEDDENVSIIKQKTMAFNKISIEETINLVDDNSLEKAVTSIEQASQVAIVAEGGSASSARCAFDAFMQIGIKCSLLIDPFFQVLGIANLPKNSIIIGVCHSGQARNTVEALKVAKDRSITTIGLVGIVGSSIMKYVDIPLLTGITEHPFFSDSITARICELSVISAIHSSLSVKRREKLGDYRKCVNELLRIKRL